MHKTAEGFEDIGFRVGTKTVAQDCLKIVGYEVERSPARLRLPAFKAFLLYQVMRHLAAQMEVDTGLVRSALGVWVWAAMLRRDVLSAAFHIFHFVQHLDGAKARWCESARLEFRIMAGLIMGMFADTGVPLAPCVFATVAQGHDDGDDWGGYGIVGTPVTKDYAQMLFARGTRPGRNDAKLDGSLGKKHARYLTSTVPFSQLQDSLLHRRKALDSSWLWPLEVWRSHYPWRGTSGFQTLCHTCCTLRLSPQQGFEFAGQHADGLRLGQRQIFFHGSQLHSAKEDSALYRQ